MSNRIEEIREKLRRLRKREVEYSVDRNTKAPSQKTPNPESFFRMNRCLSPQELSQLEQHLQVMLPEGYRRFLLEIGNGGAGPGPGVARLAFIDREKTIPSWASYFFDHGYHSSVEQAVYNYPLREPCLLRAEMLPNTNPNLDDYDSASDAEREQWDLIEGHLELGSFTLVDYGNGERTYLILSGPHRGEIWMSSMQGVSRRWEKQPGGESSLLVWYLSWLDHMLQSPREQPDGWTANHLPAQKSGSELYLKRQLALRADWARAQVELIRDSATGLIELSEALNKGEQPKAWCPACGEVRELRLVQKQILLCQPCLLWWQREKRGLH